MKAITDIKNFLKALITTGSGISSNRFLSVFVFAPCLVVAVFVGVEPEIIYTLSGLIVALLGANAIAKHKAFKQDNDDLG